MQEYENTVIFYKIISFFFFFLVFFYCYYATKLVVNVLNKEKAFKKILTQDATKHLYVYCLQYYFRKKNIRHQSIPIKVYGKANMADSINLNNIFPFFLSEEYLIYFTTSLESP